MTVNENKKTISALKVQQERNRGRLCIYKQKHVKGELKRCEQQRIQVRVNGQSAVWWDSVRVSSSRRRRQAKAEG